MEIRRKHLTYLLLDALDNHGGIFSTQPTKKCWHTHRFFETYSGKLYKLFFLKSITTLLWKCNNTLLSICRRLTYRNVRSLITLLTMAHTRHEWRVTFPLVHVTRVCRASWLAAISGFNSRATLLDFPISRRNITRFSNYSTLISWTWK